MTKELVTELRYAAGDYSLFDKSMGRDAADTIERLENELLAATIRIDNDTMEIARLTPLQYRQAPCHKFCEATAFDIEIRALKAERDAAVAELSKATDELFALSQDDGKVERALDRADTEIKKLRAERDAAIAESLEQARLPGMGSEREAALLGRVERLERDRQTLLGYLASLPRLPTEAAEVCSMLSRPSAEPLSESEPTVKDCSTGERDKLIKRLRLGASISRDRRINEDFAAIADEAADMLEADAQPKTCTWTPDDDESGTWASACGELWNFIEGGPDENRVSYCHHCGGKVVKGESK
jgi:chromosome segregation ATPase